MSSTIEQWKEILDSVIPNEGDILEQIKENLKKKHPEIYQAWKKEGFNVDYKFTMSYIEEETLLHIAAFQGHVEVVKYLVEQGAKIDEKNEYYDHTSLHLAVKGRHLEIVKFLLESGANVNAVDDIKSIPSLINNAVWNRNRISVAETLLRTGNLAEVLNQAEVRVAVSQRNKIAELIVNHIVKLEAAGLYVSEENLQEKKVFIKTSKENRNNYLQHLEICKKEVQKIKERNELLYDFLRENDVNKMADIWKENENVRNEFNNESNLKKEYPEYAHILINKASEVKKEIFS